MMVNFNCWLHVGTYMYICVYGDEDGCVCMCICMHGDGDGR